MLWVIQENIFTEPFFIKLLDFLEKVSIPYKLVKCVPFTGDIVDSNNEPLELEIDGPAIAIGSYSFTNNALAMGWSPGSWTNENYDYRVWSEKWKGFVLNEPAVVCDFSAVPYSKEPFFLRPCADDKVFTGCVYSYDEYATWRDKVLNLVKDTTTIDLNPDTQVVVAEPKHIVSEYRFVVVDGRVISGSMYKDKGVGIYKEVSKSETELLEYVNKIVSTWTPSPVFVIDIALHNGQYYVLEMGNFNSAGMYHCDIQKIVIAIEDYIHKEVMTHDGNS